MLKQEIYDIYNSNEYWTNNKKEKYNNDDVINKTNSYSAEYY